MGLFSKKKEVEPIVSVPLKQYEEEQKAQPFKTPLVLETAEALSRDIEALNSYVSSLVGIVDQEREIANILFSCAAAAIQGKRTYYLEALTDPDYSLNILRRYWTTIDQAPNAKGWIIHLIPSNTASRGCWIPRNARLEEREQD